MIQANFNQDFDSWRVAARNFILRKLLPSEINWNQQELSLFSSSDLPVEAVGLPQSIQQKLTVRPEFISLATDVSYARDDQRWDLLYRILYRLQFENSNLLKITVDSDVQRAELLQKSVKRDIHKMHAFVRFKKAEINGQEVYVAWHRPEHLIVRPGSLFFARRFGDKPWSIFTPDESAHWDLQTLSFGPGMEQNEFVTTDSWDDVWKTYYKSIFNPARIKIKAMKAEMSPKYWSSMPEATLIHDLIREAPQRLQKMADNQNQSAQVDTSLSLSQLKEKAIGCTACPLFEQATQTVFGMGPENASIMIVGEQPGDQEDQTGRPFIGPAGDILNQALEKAGLNREDLYLTNAVKHFKFTRDGKLRKHQKASGSEMHACKPWLEAEISKVKPKIILALGATAATAIIGRLPKITADRGKIITNLNIAPAVLISWHPAAILRSSDDRSSAERFEQLVSDLVLAKINVGVC